MNDILEEKTKEELIERVKFVQNEYFELNREKDKKIERLNTEIDYLNKLRDDDAKELLKKDNIINELEKVLNAEVILRYRGKDNAKENKIFNAGGMLYRDYIIDTLKELKEGKENDK